MEKATRPASAGRRQRPGDAFIGFAGFSVEGGLDNTIHIYYIYGGCG
jgi:hypothetical protein